MKKNTGKKNLKIVGATSIALFSLVAVFTATIAWFCITKNVSGSGLSVSIKESGKGLSSLKAYRCILDKSRVDNLVFDGQDEYTSSDNAQYHTISFTIEMLDYSTLSNMSPILFLFDFATWTKTPITDDQGQPVLDDQGNQTYQNVATYPIQAKDVLLTGNTQTSAMAVAPSGASASLPLSNFISFQSGIVQPSQVGTSSSNIVMLDDDGKILEVKPSSILTQNSSFVSVNQNYDPNDDESIEYPFDSNIEVFNGENDANSTAYVHFLAVVMDYNQDVIKKWKEDNLDDNDESTGDRVVFSCDFSLKI